MNKIPKQRGGLKDSNGIYLRISEEQKDKVAEIVKKTNRSATELFREILEEMLKKWA